MSLQASPQRMPEEQLKLLALHLRSERQRLLIVASPDAEAEHALAEEVCARIAGEVMVEKVSFAPEPVERLSLSYHLSSLPQPSGRAVVFAFGLDDLPPEGRETALNAMNWGRERLRWSGYSVVLWVRPGTPGELGNRAPDFFSWRSDVFEFDMPADPVERQQALARLRLFTPATTLHDLRQRYSDYVIRLYQWLDFRGLLQLRNVVRLPLDEVFVPLYATTVSDYAPQPESLERPGSGRDAERLWYTHPPLERRIALNEAVRQHRRLVVVGDPGSGKSTLLRFLALTFARGEQQVQDKLGIREERLPILVPLSAFAEARKTQPELPLMAFLPAYLTAQGLPDFSSVFTEALRSGGTIVLLDGLDEMLTYDDRTTVTSAIAEFAHAYADVRLVVTSRIAGYAPGMLPGSFTTFIVAPFDTEAIRQFARQWSLAFEARGAHATSELSPEERQRALLRAENLTAAATSHAGIRRLATNPLLLTLLALIHYQGTRLPNRRTDLYRLCVEALAETWNLARSLTGRPIDLYLGERHLDEEFVVRTLAPVAYWMHGARPTGTVERQELAEHIAAQFIDHEGVTANQAASLAGDFVNLACEQLGLIVERAPDRFSFLHLSVQEYLAARFLCERMDGFERLKPRLHHPRWREVVLLTAGCLRGDFAVAFLCNILNAHSSYDTVLQRALTLSDGSEQDETDVKQTLLSLLDVLLAANCLGDGVSVPAPLSQGICHVLFELWRHPPCSALRGDISSTFTYLHGSTVGNDVRNFLLGLLQDPDEDDTVRQDTVLALIQGWPGDHGVSTTLSNLLQNSDENSWVRRNAGLVLWRVYLENAEMENNLLHLLQNPAEHQEIRTAAAWVLGQGWARDPEVRTTLLDLLQDPDENPWVRWAAAWALGQGWPRAPEVRTALLALLQNSDENEHVRWGTIGSLGRGWREDAEVRAALLSLFQNPRESPGVRRNVVLELGRVLAGVPEGRTALLALLQNSAEHDLVRGGAAEALGENWTEDATVQATLLALLQNPSESTAIRRNVVGALGHMQQGKKAIVSALLHAVNDPCLRQDILDSLWRLLARGWTDETLNVTSL